MIYPYALSHRLFVTYQLAPNSPYPHHSMTPPFLTVFLRPINPKTPQPQIINFNQKHNHVENLSLTKESPSFNGYDDGRSQRQKDD